METIVQLIDSIIDNHDIDRDDKNDIILVACD